MSGSNERRGAGSCRERSPGSFELRYRGKRKTVKAKNDTQAERALSAFVAEVDQGKFREPVKVTVKQFVEQRWLRDHVDSNLGPRTAAVYKQYLEKRIIPVFGDTKLDKVKPENLLDFYANLREDGIREDGKEGALSPATIQKYHHILSSMFRCAVEWQIIEENPCNRVKTPKVPKRRPFSLDEKQSVRLIKSLANEPIKYRVISVIAIFTGMRRGEILGLTWENIDTDKLIININQTCQHSVGESYIHEDTKTKSSVKDLLNQPATPHKQQSVDGAEQSPDISE